MLTWRKPEAGRRFPRQSTLKVGQYIKITKSDDANIFSVGEFYRIIGFREDKTGFGTVTHVLVRVNGVECSANGADWESSVETKIRVKAGSAPTPKLNPGDTIRFLGETCGSFRNGEYYEFVRYQYGTYPTIACKNKSGYICTVYSYEYVKEKRPIPPPPIENNPFYHFMLDGV